MHTTLCRHATGTPVEYGAVARERGLAGITVTCHNPLPDGIGAHIRMYEEQFPQYLDLVAEAKSRLAPHTDVRLGLEADYMPGLEGYLEEQLNSAPFDYVLGSVHWHMPEWQQRFWTGPQRPLYHAYFDQLARAAETGLFDSISHPDLVKNATGGSWKYEDQRHLVEDALDRIAVTGVAMELNTSGRLKSFPEFNPGRSMLVAMKERGIPVVVGSDAHSPARVGDAFEDALEELAAVGYERVSMFRQRTRYEVSITEALQSLKPALVR